MSYTLRYAPPEVPACPVLLLHLGAALQFAQYLLFAVQPLNA